MQKFDIGWFLIIISFFLFLMSMLPNIGIHKKIYQLLDSYVP